jgi:hypothetical protein
MSSTMSTPRSAAQHWPSLGVAVSPRPVGPITRSFGLSVGCVLLAIGAFSAWRGHVLRAEVIASVGFVLVAAGLVRPALLARPAAGWARLAHALGWFNSRVLLTLVFALIFCPFGWIARLFGSDPLERRRPGSFWSPYPERYRDPKHCERLY